MACLVSVETNVNTNNVIKDLCILIAMASAWGFDASGHLIWILIACLAAVVSGTIYIKEFRSKYGD